MAFLNYTTSVPADRSISQIIAMLCAFRANAVMQEFDGFGNVSALSFRLKTRFGELSFRLPADVNAVQRALKADRKIQYRYHSDMAHVRNVAWRVLKDWTEAQLALIQTAQVTPEQIFLPFALVQDTGKTFYQFMEEKKFSQLALPAPTDPNVIAV